MKCVIIEDQPPAQRIIKRFIDDLGGITLEATFSEATQAISFLGENQIDLIFLDIHLPKISGIDFLKILPNRPAVILTTAFSEYAIESYELNVVDYLLKPFSFQRFTQAVTKVRNAIQETKPSLGNLPGEIFIKSGYEYLKISIGEIKYIKSDADYTDIYVGSRKHISSEPLHFWEKLFDKQQFIRIHKSYIVNSSKIKRVSGNRVFLNTDEEIPIGRAYKDDLTSRFLK